MTSVVKNKQLMSLRARLGTLGPINDRAELTQLSAAEGGGVSFYAENFNVHQHQLGVSWDREHLHF